MSKMGRWFRFYDAALDDPKVQRLTADEFRFWVNLLCLANRNDGKLPDPKSAAFSLRMTPAEYGPALRDLVHAGLFDRVGNEWEPHNWAFRQYKSDVSTERVKRFRKRKSTVTETPSESETETEADTDKEATPPSAQEIDDDKPFKLTNDWQPSDACRDYAAGKGLDAQAVAEGFADYFVDGKGKREKRTGPAWERRWRIWCNREAGQSSRRPQAVRAARSGSELAAFVRGASRVVGDEPVQ